MLISAPAPSIISAKCLKEFDDFVCLFCPRSLEHILGYPEMINALYHLNYNNAIPVCKISSIRDSLDNPSSSALSSFWQQQKNAKARNMEKAPYDSQASLVKVGILACPIFEAVEQLVGRLVAAMLLHLALATA